MLDPRENDALSNKSQLDKERVANAHKRNEGLRDIVSRCIRTLFLLLFLILIDELAFKLDERSI